MTLLRSLIITTMMAMVTPAMSLTVGARLTPRFHRATASSISGQWWSYSTMYESSSCDDDVPFSFFAFPECFLESESSECTTIDYTGTSYDPNNITADPLAYEVRSCAADVDELVDSLYGDRAYIRFDYYSDLDCQTLDTIKTYAVDGDCHAVYAVNVSTHEIFTESWRVFVNDNGSITLQFFYNKDCSGVEELGTVFERDDLVSNECVKGSITSTNAKAEDPAAQVKGVDGDDNSGVGAGTIAGIVVACIVAIGLV